MFVDRLERSKLQEVRKFIYARSIETGAKQVRNIYSSISNVLGSMKGENESRNYDTFNTMHQSERNTQQGTNPNLPRHAYVEVFRFVADGSSARLSGADRRSGEVSAVEDGNSDLLIPGK